MGVEIQDNPLAVFW